MCNKNYPIAFACYNKNLDIRMQSTSGGVFTAIATYVIEELHGMVYGAAFDEEYNVQHIGVSSVEGLSKLRGSKYSQSNIGNTYIEIKEHLDNGKVILFTGTPCQVYGLKMFLKKEYNNLYCMDFVCHGVASEKVWRAYVDTLKRKGNLKGITFKSKVKGWKKWYFRASYDDKVYQMRGALNTFMRSYLSYCNIRPSCFECKFKGLQRSSDFTISDCWGIAEMNKEINDDKGLSALLLQNEKAEKVFECIKNEVQYLEYPAEILMEGNWTTIKSIKPNAIYDKFFKSVREDGAEYALNKYFKPTFKSWLKYYFLRLLGKEK